MLFKYDDGGRSQYFQGVAGDCVIRSIAIATRMDYKALYDELQNRQRDYRERKGRLRRSVRNGVTPKVFKPFLEEIGAKWVPTMLIGQGCRVHLAEGELPNVGRLIVRCAKHLTAVIDGVIHDTSDPSREGTRCVYGYWIVPNIFPASHYCDFFKNNRETEAEAMRVREAIQGFIEFLKNDARGIYRTTLCYGIAEEDSERVEELITQYINNKGE